MIIVCVEIGWNGCYPFHDVQRETQTLHQLISSLPFNTARYYLHKRVQIQYTPTFQTQATKKSKSSHCVNFIGH